jgi:hypothetical protein
MDVGRGSVPPFIIPGWKAQLSSRRPRQRASAEPAPTPTHRHAVRSRKSTIWLPSPPMGLTTHAAAQAG